MTHGWGAPARAYELTASAAESGWAAAGSALASMDTGELAGLISALGAQARQAAVLASGPGAGAVRAGQLAVAEELGEHLDAREITIRALQGADATGQAPAAALREAATCLLAIITGTLRAGGWADRSIAVLCRRNAAS